VTRGDRASDYSIGEFARLGGVTAKALRHYDRLGVLHPAVVDERTGYRRYSADQLAELYEVLSLTRLGLTLRQVRDAVAPDRHARSLMRTLRVAKREIEARVEEDRVRLSWIESRLATLGGAQSGPTDSTSSVVIKRVPARRVLTMRRTLDSYSGADLLLEELAGDSPPTPAHSHLRGTVWHDCGESSGVIDCEAVVSVDPCPLTAKRGQLRELPAGMLACVIHRGSDESAQLTYVTARRWIRVHGYAVVGPNREWYLGDVSGTPVTEIQFPISPASGHER
jgi:DNA-binding transcriptional MerR regulator